MADRVRVLRILEYVGDREWVEETLKMSHVPNDGAHYLSNGNVIKSSIIDKFPEILDEGVKEGDFDGNKEH